MKVVAEVNEMLETKSEFADMIMEAIFRLVNCRPFEATGSRSRSYMNIMVLSEIV